jgi:hypothetical protein
MGKQRRQKIVMIIVGSNSIHMIVAEAPPDGH